MSKLLKHYGVLGMHWGVRTGGKSGKGGRSSASSDSKAARALRGRSLSSLSNEELKTLTTRMQLERQYKDLKSKDVSSGQKWITDLVASSGKEVAKGYVTQALGSAANQAIELFPKPQ